MCGGFDWVHAVVESLHTVAAGAEVPGHRKRGVAAADVTDETRTAVADIEAAVAGTGTAVVDAVVVRMVLVGGRGPDSPMLALLTRPCQPEP